jgi:hypothetical protein
MKMWHEVVAARPAEADHSLVERERASIAADPEGELDELAAIYEAFRAEFRPRAPGTRRDGLAGLVADGPADGEADRPQPGAGHGRVQAPIRGCVELPVTHPVALPCPAATEGDG